MRNLLEITDLSIYEIDQLIKVALDIIDNPQKYSSSCKGKKLATLFYEPSTRTRLSFTSAMMELGGNVLGFSDAAASSVSKGETVADTVRVVENFADIIAMRHHKEGAPQLGALYASIPIINAGDGGHCHPTQTLTDLLTIYRHKGTFSGINIGLCGDLLYGRTVHSLTKALARYKKVNFTFIAPKELKMPDYIKEEIKNKDCQYVEIESLEEAIPQLDILYMTRVQKERFSSEEEYNKLKDSFILDKAKMDRAKKDCIVLHPLPRVNEIAQDVDSDPRALYFKQVLNGKYIRMALIYTLLQWAEKHPTAQQNNFIEDVACRNPRCISSIEKVRPLYNIYQNDMKRCIYCDTFL